MTHACSFFSTFSVKLKCEIVNFPQKHVFKTHGCSFFSTFPVKLKCEIVNFPQKHVYKTHTYFIFYTFSMFLSQTAHIDTHIYMHTHVFWKATLNLYMSKSRKNVEIWHMDVHFSPLFQRFWKIFKPMISKANENTSSPIIHNNVLKKITMSKKL